MSTQKIPNSQKQIIQSNDGDYNGNIWSTFNIDLDSDPGTIKTSKKLTKAVGFDTISSSVVQALQIHDGYYYIATNDDVYRCDVNDDPRVEANWSSVSSFDGDDLGFETDMTSFEGQLLVSLGTNIAAYISTVDDDWWTTGARSGTALTANLPHIMDVLRSGRDTLFITDGSKIRYYNGVSGGTIVEIDSLLTASCMTPSLDRMWVGSYTEVGNHASVFEVAVGATNTLGDPAYNQSYEVDGRVCLTMWTYRNTPFVITERGYIQAFNGASFETVAQFPWANDSTVMKGCNPGNVQDSSTSRAIHPKGARVKGRYCYIMVDTTDGFNSGAKINDRSPSGVWVLDMQTYSLTHRYALTDKTDQFGQQVLTRSGPVLITNTNQTRIMVGGAVDSQDGADNDEAVWMESDITNQGYLVTTRHESNSIADAFESVYVKADTLDTDETVTLKYKDVTIPNFPLSIEDVFWLSPNQFTTTNALTNVEEGDEVEITRRDHSGELCNITKIEGTTTKTVTVDKNLGTLNDTSDIQIDRYKLMTDEYVANNGEYKKIGDGKTSPSRQYKVVMKGDVTVREIISKSNSKVEL